MSYKLCPMICLGYPRESSNLWLWHWQWVKAGMLPNSLMFIAKKIQQDQSHWAIRPGECTTLLSSQVPGNRGLHAGGTEPRLIWFSASSALARFFFVFPLPLYWVPTTEQGHYKVSLLHVFGTWCAGANAISTRTKLETSYTLICIQEKDQ